MKDFFWLFLSAFTASVVTMAFDRAIITHIEPEEAKQAVCDTLSDWQILEMAIAFTESRFKTDAMGKAEDTGVLQIRPIYIDEVNRLSGRDYTIEDALDPCMSLEMFNIVQGARNPTKDMEEAIRLHNKSPYYRKVVLDNVDLIRRAEEMRRKIINFGDYETGE